MSDARSHAIAGGLRDPVFGSQAVFRRVMDALARPGTTADLAGLAEPPAGLAEGAAAILAALSDPDARVFLKAPSADAAAWLAFHTGAAPVAEPGDAAFAVLARDCDPQSWSRFPLGDQAYPDRSATLLLPVASLEGGPALSLRGPGIETSRAIHPQGLPAGFLAARAANARLFPRGHDLILVAEARIVALPRTTLVEEV